MTKCGIIVVTYLRQASQAGLFFQSDSKVYEKNLSGTILFEILPGNSLHKIIS